MISTLNLEKRKTEQEERIIDKKIDDLSVKVNKITKWSRFKEERSQIIDKYLKQKRIHMIKLGVFRLITVS
jgi:hypothetical protein